MIVDLEYFRTDFLDRSSLGTVQSASSSNVYGELHPLSWRKTRQNRNSEMSNFLRYTCLIH
jgi:hypothetical protein